MTILNHTVLESRVPPEGRCLTPEECSRLKDLGIQASSAMTVFPDNLSGVSGVMHYYHYVTKKRWLPSKFRLHYLPQGRFLAERPHWRVVVPAAIPTMKRNGETVGFCAEKDGRVVLTLSPELAKLARPNDRIIWWIQSSDSLPYVYLCGHLIRDGELHDLRGNLKRKVFTNKGEYIPDRAAHLTIADSSLCYVDYLKM